MEIREYGIDYSCYSMEREQIISKVMNDSAEMSVGQSSDVEPTCGLNLMRLGSREKFLHCRLLSFLPF